MSYRDGRWTLNNNLIRYFVGSDSTLVPVTEQEARDVIAAGEV